MRAFRNRELIDDESTSIPDDADSYTGIRNFVCPSVRRTDTADHPLKQFSVDIILIGRSYQAAVRIEP